MLCLRIAVVGLVAVAVVPVVGVADEQAASEPVSFRYEVLPILTKSGCNQGTCHGTPTGKNGFRLSLRGFDPAEDWNSLVRETHGRRINRVDVDHSLILLKAINDLPHEGGRRLDRESAEFQRLWQWITEGAEDDIARVPALRQLSIQPDHAELEASQSTQPLQVTARFADGTERDVTNLCRWSSSDASVAASDATGLVTKQQRGEATITAEFCGHFASSRLLFREPVPGFRWPEIAEHNEIDRLVFAKLRQLQIEPSPVSSDAVFLRRVMIDLTGQLPTPDRVRAFLADTSADKRSRLIDQLLESPAHADWWAMKWTDRLGGNQRYTGKFGAMKYHAWIRAAMAENLPEDEFARTLLTASGPNYEHPPASFWRRMRVGGIGKEVDAELAAEEVSQLFLGVRIQCARCHNHPGERWTQGDFHGLAAFFKPLKFKQGSFFVNVYDKEDVVYVGDAAEVRHPRTGATIPPTLLDAGPVDIAPGDDPREAFATWLTAPDNRWFARNSVNRLWYHLFGRGLVDPVDDFRDTNPPSHPEVLDLLTREFVSSGFNRRQILRMIALSQVYQLEAHILPTNAEDRQYFSRAQIRLLPAEALLDAVSQATEVAESFPNVPHGTRAVELPDGEYKHPFLEAFGRPARALACECERDTSTNFQQALQLVSGQTVADKLHSDRGRAARLAATTLSPAEVVDELFLATLSRFPDSAEREFLLRKFDPPADRRAATEDILWMLLNHQEFLFLH